MNTIPPTNGNTRSRALKAWHRPTKIKIAPQRFKSGPGGPDNETNVAKTKTAAPFKLHAIMSFNKNGTQPLTISQNVMFSSQSTSEKEFQQSSYEQEFKAAS